MECMCILVVEGVRLRPRVEEDIVSREISFLAACP